MEPILSLKHIYKTYGKIVQTKVLHDVSLNIEAGSFNSIIGQSGSGKTTLLNIMGTLDTPTDGKIQILGKDTTVMSSSELAYLRNQQMGFVFQFHYLLPEFSVLENILLPYRMHSFKVPEDIRERALYYLELTGLTAVMNNRSDRISGGQQQRTAIARALINQPNIIFADEPTGNLDSDTTEKIYDLLRMINREMKTTFVIITHDRKIAEKADRIIEIKDGRIHLDLNPTASVL